MATSLATNLSALASGSRQVCITLQEGTPIELDPSSLVATAAYSSIGVGTRLRLIAYSEELSTSNAADEGGIPLIRAIATVTGNGSLIPIPRGKADNAEHFSGEYSTGATSVTVSSSRQPEKALLCYDPVTYSDGTATAALSSGFVFVFSSVASTADLGDVGWTPNAITADVVLADIEGVSWICVREDTSLNRILTAAHTMASPGGSRSVRFSAEAPVPGAGWTLFDSAKKALYLAADVQLNGNTAIFPFFTTSALVPNGSINRDKWNAFALSSIGTTGVSSSLKEAFFRTSGPADGTINSLPLITIARASPVGHARRVRTIWNAEQVFGENDQRYGGVNTD